METNNIKPVLELGGRIKVYPEDFVVEEITLDKKVCSVAPSVIETIKDALPKERKEHVHFTLVKNNWTTLRAVAELSHRLRISRSRFGFAGTKDRRAITAQRVSAWNVKIEQLQDIQIKDILLKDFEYSDDRLTLGDLYGNKFTITIRDVKTLGEIEHVPELIAKGIPNYFGPQRFGIQRQTNHLVGKQLLLGNFEGAAMIMLTAAGREDEASTNARKFASENWGKWNEILKIWPRNLGTEAAVLNYLAQYPKDYANAIRELPKNLRRMFIHAVQSYIFNYVLSTAKEISEKIPLVGYDTKLEGEIGELIENKLKEEGIKLEDFKLKRYPELSEPGSDRVSKIFVQDFKILNIDKDSVKIEFVLDKGTYATTLLAYIGVNVED